MGEQSVFDRMMCNLCATCKMLGHISEREFVQILHQSHPVVVAFKIRGNYAKHLDKVLEEAAVNFYPHVKFMRVECPKFPGFCVSRQKKEYPFIEIFHSPEQYGSGTRIFHYQLKLLLDVLVKQASNQGRVADPNITKYSVKVLPFNYNESVYGFKEYFKRHGIRSSDPV